MRRWPLVLAGALVAAGCRGDGRWRSAHGLWWAAHYCRDGFASLGVHVDLRRRRAATDGARYGPYVDAHVGPAVLSVGVNPIRTTDDYASWRAGERA